MKPEKWARLVLAAAPLLVILTTGCSGFWTPPSTTTGTTCTTNCTTASSGAFYILNGGTNPQVVGESIQSGTLTGINGSPWGLEATPYSMGIAPNGNFLMVATTSGVFAYPITNGVLGTATVVSEDQAYGVEVDATGSWLLEAIPESGGVTIGALPIDTTTGAISGTEQTASFSVTNAAVQPGKLVISGDNSNLFVSLGAGGTLILPFNAGVTSGSSPLGAKATTIPVTSTGGSAVSVGVDPGTTPRLFYVGETLANPAHTSGGLRVFNYSSLGGTLTQATGSPIASGGLAPNAILPVSTGDYVYVANGQGTSTAGNIAGFTIGSTGTTTLTYSITAGTTVAAGVQPLSLAEDASDTFVLEVGSLGSPYFDAFTFDATTAGTLDSQLSSSTSSGSIAVVAAP
jgi:hypothetical protein